MQFCISRIYSILEQCTKTLLLHFVYTLSHTRPLSGAMFHMKATFFLQFEPFYCADSAKAIISRSPQEDAQCGSRGSHCPVWSQPGCLHLGVRPGTTEEAHHQDPL